MRSVQVAVVLIPALLTPIESGELRGDTSKLGVEEVRVDDRGPASGKGEYNPCCGYPLVGEHEFALRFYWLAMQDDFEPDQAHVAIYSREGFFIGAFQEKFVKALLMEGSGLLSDGRVINYNGSCRFGVGTCYEPLDEREYPYGRGAGRRALVPFKSVAVDPRLVKRKMDFFVVTYGNFRYLLDLLYGVIWVTPHIEHPRCEYLRQE